MLQSLRSCYRITGMASESKLGKYLKCKVCYTYDDGGSNTQDSYSDVMTSCLYTSF